MCGGLDFRIPPKPHVVIGAACWGWLDLSCVWLGLTHRSWVGLRMEVYPPRAVTPGTVRSWDGFFLVAIFYLLLAV